VPAQRALSLEARLPFATLSPAGGFLAAVLSAGGFGFWATGNFDLLVGATGACHFGGLVLVCLVERCGCCVFCVGVILC
jgi:hypothetical protein